MLIVVIVRANLAATAILPFGFLNLELITRTYPKTSFSNRIVQLKWRNPLNS